MIPERWVMKIDSLALAEEVLTWCEGHGYMWRSKTTPLSRLTEYFSDVSERMTRYICAEGHALCNGAGFEYTSGVYTIVTMQDLYGNQMSSADFDSLFEEG